MSGTKKIIVKSQEITRLKAENERLRAHIQDAADKHAWCIGVCDYPEDKQVHEAIRDWHLAALAPQEPSQ